MQLMVLFATTKLNFDFDFDIWFVFIINNWFLLFILGVLKTHIKVVTVFNFILHFYSLQLFVTGSQSASCNGNGKFTCNVGYEGQKCSQCAKGFYMKWLNSQYLCSGINTLVALICLT